MRVLAIDPGYDRLGVAVLEAQNKKEVVLYSTCVTTDKQSPLPDRLLLMGTTITNILETYQPQLLAVETLFFNQNQKTAMGVAEARGIVIFLAKQSGCDIVEFGPQEVKVAVTGYGKSDKRAVIEMIKRLVPTAPLTALDDEYDAIAVGITALAHHR